MSTFKKYKIGEDHKVVLDLGLHLSSDHLCKKIESIVSELDTKKIESNYSSICLLYTSPSPRDATLSRMPSSA